jgi:cytochrome c-type biogenesis protein CcmH
MPRKIFLILSWREAPRRRTHIAFAAVLLFLLAALFPAFAVEPSEMLKNPVLEARARTISKELRCLVCQNESIDESNADLAHDLRVLLRQRLQAGDTDRQAIDFIVKRYGDFVLLKPPVEPATYFLWFGPAAVLLIGAVGALLFVRRRNRTLPEPPPLSVPEKQRLETLLREPH